MDGRAHARGLRRRTCSTYLGNTAEYTYSETPPPASRTLDGFLFDSKQGYCQQFSGAMALLLRMAGIPARVSTGFSTGATDTKTGEYVVRDFDAHSWVEVYYPDYGWVTFDPTPAASPARSPARRRRPAPAARHRQRAASRPATRSPSAAPASRSPPRRARGGTTRCSSLALLAAARARRSSASAAGAAARRRRSSELERALKRTRREPAPGTTLHALELRFAATPAAAGLRARAAREPLPRRARAAHPRPAPRPAVRARTRRRPARPPARLVGPAAPISACLRGPTIQGWTMSMTSISEEWRCWRTGTSTRRRSRWPRPAIWTPRRPRSARPRPGVLPLRRLRAGPRGVRGGRRARAHERLRAVLPRPRLMQLGRTAEARKPLTLAAT